MPKLTQEKLEALRSRYSIYLVLIFMIIVCNFLNPNFLSSRNLANISAQISVTTILAFGETILIIGGMLDLSCGSVLAFAGLMSVYFFKLTGSLPLAFGLGIIFGMLWNVVNGVLVRYFKVPAFIATLAVMAMARGAALLFTKGRNLYQIGDFVCFGQGYIGPVPIPVVFMILVGILTWYNSLPHKLWSFPVRSWRQRRSSQSFGNQCGPNPDRCLPDKRCICRSCRYSVYVTHQCRCT